MLSKEQVRREEENLREEVRHLPDYKKKVFYRLLEKKIKDPDTYAVANWFFLIGVHHFYLGRWLQGLLVIAVFFASIPMLFYHGLGAIPLLLVIGSEIYALVRSETIVQDYNNSVASDILTKLKNDDYQGLRKYYSRSRREADDTAGERRPQLAASD
jgi:TM2 domain-containing membrane protein YozV